MKLDSNIRSLLWDLVYCFLYGQYFLCPRDHFCNLWIFIYLFLAVPGLHCCSGFSLVVASGGYSLSVVCRLLIRAFQVLLVVESPFANAGDIKGAVSTPGGGHGNPPRYSCLENPVGRGACWTTVRGVTQSWTRLTRHCGGFPCCGVWAPGHLGFSSCGSWALEQGSIVVHGLSCSGARGVFPVQALNLSPALAGGCFTTEPPSLAAGPRSVLKAWLYHGRY